jgi:hypothetical protein
MSTTARRPRLALFAVAAAAVAAGLPTAASAASTDVPPTTLAGWTLTEGRPTDLRVKLTCQRGLGPCTFVVDAIGLTAKRGTDFTARTSPTRSKLRIRRAGRSMVATVRFTALDDGVCEGTELARVRVTKRTRRQGGRRDYGTITIKDADCETPATPTAPAPPTPAPTTPDPAPGTPAPAFPPDAGTPTVRTTALTNGTLGECTTPQWIGTEATAGANGWFNRGCAVKVACPPEARVCRVTAEGRHVLERAVDGERVSLNSRITAFSASDVAFWFRDQSSSGAGFTRTEDPGVMIRGGESARVECNGVRIAPTAPNRSTVGCALAVERVS